MTAVVGEVHWKLLRNKLTAAWQQNRPEQASSDLCDDDEKRLACIHAGLQPLLGIRKTPRDAARHRTFHVALCGFGCKKLRDAVLQTLRYFLRPHVIHACMLAERRWEAFIVASLPEDMPRDKGLLAERTPMIDHLEAVCDNFAASIVLFELDDGLGPQMMAFLARIENGFSIWGNFKAKRNAPLRCEYVLKRERERHAAAETLRAQASGEVLSRLGVAFTPSNMIQAYEQVERLREDVQHWRHTNNRNVAEARTHLDRLYARMQALEGRLLATWAHTTQPPPTHDAMLGLLREAIDELRSMRDSRSAFFTQSSTSVPESATTAIPGSTVNTVNVITLAHQIDNFRTRLMNFEWNAGARSFQPTWLPSSAPAYELEMPPLAHGAGPIDLREQAPPPPPVESPSYPPSSPRTGDVEMSLNMQD